MCVCVSACVCVYVCVCLCVFVCAASFSYTHVTLPMCRVVCVFVPSCFCARISRYTDTGEFCAESPREWRLCTFVQSCSC